ncbi:hypothetical protein FRX31_031752 [Thalictrum thalictroides]|uniref:Uncharacterized protein n=1 Tax=Thalictrum thalictroides TaxID=46969 RepID=A0A7J6V2M9_THATH|nr:hypothetical protein FRX31_031752 [Thalictrum thalictroides]
MAKKALASVAMRKGKAKVGCKTKEKEKKQTVKTKTPLEKGMHWTTRGAYLVSDDVKNVAAEDIGSKFGIDGFEVIKEYEMIGELRENMVRGMRCWN